MLTISRKSLDELAETMMVTALQLCDERGLRIMVTPNYELAEKLALAVLGLLGPDQVRPDDVTYVNFSLKDWKADPDEQSDPMALKGK